MTYTDLVAVVTPFVTVLAIIVLCYTFGSSRLATPPVRWRHKVRGSTYTEVGRGCLQSTVHDFDYMPVVIYRADVNGTLWVRPVAEFEDGRFERVTP